MTIIPRNNIFYITGMIFFYYHLGRSWKPFGHHFPEIGVTHFKIDKITVFYDFFSPVPGLFAIK